MSDPAAPAAAGEPFLSTTFRGERFEGGRLPLTVAADLAALNELLVDLAREIFLGRHPNRKKLPRGYRPSTSLWISEISEGSAQLVLERDRGGRLPINVVDDPLIEARELLLEAIAAADDESPLPAAFPEWAKRRFNKIGRSLSDADEVDLTSPTSRRTARYNRTIRARLVEEVAPIEDDYFAVGPLQAFNADNGTFRIMTADGPVDGSFDEELDRPLREATAKGSYRAKYLDGSVPFRIDGTARFRGKKLEGFTAESVVPIEFAEGPTTFAEVVQRVKDLLLLQAGWLDGEGEEVTEDTAEEFLQVLVTLADLEQPCPTIFPTECGQLRAEWEIAEFEVVWEPEQEGSHFVQARRIGTLDYFEHDIAVGLSAADVGERLSQILSEYAAGDVETDDDG